MVLLSAVAAVVFAVLAVFTERSAGLILLVVAALGLAAFTAHGLRARPRLTVDHDGIEVRSLSGVHRWFHGQVRVFVRETRRLGRTVHLVELDGIDTDGEPRLVLLGRLDLGADPVEVLDQIAVFRPADAERD